MSTVNTKASLLKVLKTKIKYQDLRDAFLENSFLLPVYIPHNEHFPIEADGQVSDKLSTPVKQNNGEIYFPKFKKETITKLLDKIKTAAVAKKQFQKYVTLTSTDLANLYDIPLKDVKKKIQIESIHVFEVGRPTVSWRGG